MASLIAKKKANKLYYYVVESARVDGKPRIVHQTCLGTAERVAALVRDRTAPVPLEATAVDVGLPGALWLAAQKTGVFAVRPKGVDYQRGKDPYKQLSVGLGSLRASEPGKRNGRSLAIKPTYGG